MKIIPFILTIIISLGNFSTANASIIGDSFDYSVSFTNSGNIGSGSATAIDPGEDVTIFNSFNAFNLTIDFQAGGLLELSHDLTGFGLVGDTITWELTDLDWLPTAGEIVGISQIGGNGGGATSAFTADSLTIVTPDETNPPVIHNYVFQLETSHSQGAIPEPTSLIVWGLLGVVGLKYRRR